MIDRLPDWVLWAFFPRAWDERERRRRQEFRDMMAKGIRESMKRVSKRLAENNDLLRKLREKGGDDD